MEHLAVECKGVQKSYYSGQTVTPALRGIDLSIKQGELFMLVGPSGCGKTTLISVIAGILLQDQGQVLVLDNDLKTMSDKMRTAYRGSSLGFVFQSYNLIPTLSVWENISVPLLLNGGNLKDAKDKCYQMLSDVGLSGKEEVRPSQLSGGQQQRVAVARALIHEPKVVVCDEPTSALDKDTGQRIMELFRNVALANGRTLIIVSHDNRIFKFADRVAVMSDGKIESISTPDQLTH